MAKGHIVIDENRCKGCELCISACPQHVITLAVGHNSMGYRPALYLDAQHECTGCALCAVVCPDACITVYKEVAAKPAYKPANGTKKEALRYAEAIA